MEVPQTDPDDEPKTSTITLKEKVWRRLDEIAAVEGRSRNWMVSFFIDWAIPEWERTRLEKGLPLKPVGRAQPKKKRR